MAVPTITATNDGMADLNLHAAEQPCTNDSADPAIESSLKPGLTSIPRELRYKIYTHFLKANANAQDLQARNKSAFSYEVLWICRDLREEAWTYFCTSNKWMQVGFYDRSVDGHYDHEPMTPPSQSICLPLARFPKAFTKQVVDNQALTVRLGYGCGLKKLPTNAKLIQRILFAFDRHCWWLLCTQFAEFNLETPLGFSIDIGPKFVPNDGWRVLMPHYILPLAIIRSATRVRFTKLMEKPALKAVAAAMTHCRSLPEDHHEYFTALLEYASTFEKLGMTTEAFKIRACWQFPRAGTGPGWDTTNPSFNANQSLIADVLLTEVAARLAILRDDAHMQNMKPAIHDDLFKAEQLLQDTLLWKGLSATQRMRLHHSMGLCQYLYSIYFECQENYDYALELSCG